MKVIITVISEANTIPRCATDIIFISSLHSELSRTLCTTLIESVAVVLSVTKNLFFEDSFVYRILQYAQDDRSFTQMRFPVAFHSNNCCSEQNKSVHY